jgi:hypothetical protein
MAAGPTDPAGSPGCNCGASAQANRPAVVQDQSGPLGLGLRDKLRNLFGGSPPPAPFQPARPAVTYQTAAYQPANYAPQPTRIVPQANYGTEPPVVPQQAYTVYHQGGMTQPAVVTAAPANLTAGPSADLQIAPKYQEKVGHETDYSWITGHLFHVRTDGGKWVVRYAGPGEIDRFGGSVVLTPTVEMRNFREGDLVNVYGEVLNDGQAAHPLGGALYRANSILLVERADPE